MLADIYLYKAGSEALKAIILKRILSMETDERRQNDLSNQLNLLRVEINESRRNLTEQVEEAQKFYMQKKWEKAVRAYKKLNSWNLDQEELFLEQGIAYQNINDWDSSVDAFYRGLLIQPNNYELNILLGNYYFSKNKWFPAIIHFQKAIRSIPKRNDNENLRKKIQISLKTMVNSSQSRRIGNLSKDQQSKIRDLYKTNVTLKN